MRSYDPDLQAFTQEAFPVASAPEAEKLPWPLQVYILYSQCLKLPASSDILLYSVHCHESHALNSGVALGCACPGRR